jgi:NAD(P)-dependent dehydrogenase (short-subunit alcohol dehydrogenase family)
MFDLKNKVAIVTGASGILASSIIKSLARSGVHLVLLSRNKESLRDLEEDISKFDTKVLSLECDILSKDSLMKVKDSVLKHFGRIDILLNVAGGNLPGATIRPDQNVFDMSLDDFNTVVELNLNGTVLPCMVFAEVMAQQKYGTIVNYSSMAAQRTITRVAGYSASKAAMENFTKWLAIEMAMKFGEGIRVNAIAPGFFIGKQNKRLLLNEDGSYTERGKRIIENTPMGRFGEAEELNGAVHFLCSDASKFVTGIVLPIDGGFNAFSGV